MFSFSPLSLSTNSNETKLIFRERKAITLLPPPTTTPLTPSGVFISTDTFLHPSAYEHMGEKVGLKRCIVGKGCWIGKGSKLTGCLLMEGCRVGEGYVHHSPLPIFFVEAEY